MAPERQITAALLLETGDARCVALSVRPDGMRLRLDRPARVVGTVRLAFEYDSEVAAGVVRMLAAVDGTSSGGDTNQPVVDIRFLALHTTEGRLCLRGFLADVIGLSAPDEQAFKAGAGGWFYGFGGARPKAAGRTPVQRESGVVAASQRRDPRVAVRVPVVLQVDGAVIKAQAYNVSASGLYVLLDEALPPVSTTVEVSYPVALHARPFTIALAGEVVWCMPAMTSSQGGGIGIQLSTIDDGAGGDAWREYVTREVEFGGAVKAGGRPD